VYGENPIGEANVSVQILDTNVDGLIIDAESEYEGKPDNATIYMEQIRTNHPNSFIAYTTFPIIDYHLNFPYLEFGKYCDAVMPQVYWKEIGVSPEGMINWMETQWNKWHNTWKESGNSLSVKPIVPIGQGWDVTGGEIEQFCDLIYNHGYIGVSLWRYGTMSMENWDAYANCFVLPQTGKVSVSNSYGTANQRTSGWTFPTSYNAPVFRRGKDNPTFILTLDNRIPAGYIYDALFEVYSPNNPDPITSIKSHFYYDDYSFAIIWCWTDSDGNTLDISNLPVGTYIVKGSLVNIDDPSGRIYIGSSRFYVIFDYNENIQSFVTWDKECGYLTGGDNNIYARGYDLHLYRSKIWKTAIEWVNGAVTIEEAVDKLSRLVRRIDGRMVYHHAGDNEKSVFGSDEYDNDFDGEID
ncbi:unnamed protein product, partial [marine sediment metagenome]